MNSTVMALTEHKLAVEVLKLLETTSVNTVDCVLQIFRAPSLAEPGKQTFTCLYFPPNNKSFVRVDMNISNVLLDDWLTQAGTADYFVNNIVSEMSKVKDNK